MISAEDARELSKYKKYFDDIKKAAISGKTSIYIYDCSSLDYTIFEEMGYTVNKTLSSQKDGDVYLISW